MRASPAIASAKAGCCSFSDRYKAYEFEKYLKSGSGRAIAKKHLL
jgi:hypothetical protein